jgi:hypothetical protein
MLRNLGHEPDWRKSNHDNGQVEDGLSKGRNGLEDQIASSDLLAKATLEGHNSLLRNVLEAHEHLLESSQSLVSDGSRNTIRFHWYRLETSESFGPQTCELGLVSSRAH